MRIRVIWLQMSFVMITTTHIRQIYGGEENHKLSHLNFLLVKLTSSQLNYFKVEHSLFRCICSFLSSVFSCVDHESDPLPSRIDANDGDLCNVSELSLMLLRRNKLILIHSKPLTILKLSFRKITNFSQHENHPGIVSTQNLKR